MVIGYLARAHGNEGKNKGAVSAYEDVLERVLGHVKASENLIGSKVRQFLSGKVPSARSCDEVGAGGAHIIIRHIHIVC